MRATKKQKKQIAQLAKALPTLNWKEKVNKVSISGAELLYKNPKAVDRAGKPINPLEQYTISTPRPVNHQKEMIMICEDKGMDEVRLYVEQMRQFDNAKPEENEVSELHNK